MFQLLNIWTEYITIIYQPEADINVHSHLKSKGKNVWAASTDDDLKSTLASKIQSENIEEKIQSLFAKED